MGKVLKVIGTPFIKLWTWIKETAWVQPLLIVGIIFAVIFSIPSITSWVQSWNFGSDTYTFLQNKKLSLEGMTDVPSGQAADFFSSYVSAREKWSNDDKEGARNDMKAYVGDSNKMILFFVAEDDTGASVNEAANYLVNEGWSNLVTAEFPEAPAFQYQAIFTDQTIDLGDDDDTYKDKNPFAYLWQSADYQQFVEDAYFVTTVSPYYINLEEASAKTTLKNNAENIVSSSNYTSNLAYYVTIDLTDTNTTDNIITNVFFEITGADKYEKAEFLSEAWTNSEDFEIKTKN